MRLGVALVFMACLPLAGCGVGESLTTAAVVATQQSEENRQGQETVQAVEQQLDQALQQGRQRTEDAADAAAR